MKFFAAEFLTYKNLPGQRNTRLLVRFLLSMLVVILVYSLIFLVLMKREGQDHSFITAVYWTLTVMSTLGFGDITFHSDAGRFFSIVVLITGTMTLLIILPFLFIQFVYQPWMESENRSRAPTELPPETRGHVLLTHYGNITMALIHKLTQFDYTYAVIIPDLEEALRLNDAGVNVMLGALDDPDTWRKARVDQAELVATTQNDALNTNIAFTVRAVHEEVPIVATANDPASVDILHLAGCTQVMQMGESMGRMLARRVVATDTDAHIIGNFDELLILEAAIHDTPLIGKTIEECGVKEKSGLTICGVWERNSFRSVNPKTVLKETSVLVMTGTRHQFRSYNELFGGNRTEQPVIIIGGGRVGRSAARYLGRRSIPYRIVEKDPSRLKDDTHYIYGSAAEREVLDEAGIAKAPAVLITTRDDDINVYLTIYCRQLRPDVQVLARCVLERNASTLHRAGADYVLSYATVGANRLFNEIHDTQEQLLEVGQGFFRLPIPEGLQGKTLAEEELWKKTGCTAIAIRNSEGRYRSPDPDKPLPATGEIVLFGREEAEFAFLKQYVNA